MRKKRKIFLSILLIEIILLVIVLLFGFQKNQQDTFTPAKGITMTYPKIDNLHYYYEPKENTIFHQDLSFLGKDFQRTVTYTMNRDGLNQLFDAEITKPKDTYRIVSIGESFTFGYNVNTHESYPNQLQNLLNQSPICPTSKKYEVLNLGVPAYDAQYTIARYKRKGEKYDANLIIWIFVQGDLTRLNEEFLPIYKKYIQEMKKSGELQREYSKGNFQAPWFRAKNEVFRKIGEQNILSLNKKYIRDFVKTTNKKILFVSLSPFNKIDTDILTSTQESHKNVYYYNSSVNTYSDKTLSFPDYHPTEKGYQVIASDIFQYLQKHKAEFCH